MSNFSGSIYSFSIVAGSMVCNAHCKFCVAGMTPNQGLESIEPAIDVISFHEAARLARAGGASTALITGKGEPTLFPGQIGTCLAMLNEHGFAYAELQSNGITFSKKRKQMEQHLKTWRPLGLRYIALSVVHWEPEINQQCYMRGNEQYHDLPELISYLHSFGYRIRLSVVLANGFVDSVDKLQRMIDFARENKVEQLTIRRATKSDAANEQNDVWRWIDQNALSDSIWGEMEEHVAAVGTHYNSLGYGARMYDVGGQNVCLTNCLTRNENGGELRQLIFWPDGRITTDWSLAGAQL